MNNYEFIRIQPRDHSLCVSQNRTVLSTDRRGFIRGHPEHGLFVDETRMISQYLLLIDGNVPMFVVASNVQQHSWLGYYIAPPPRESPSKTGHSAGQGAPDAARESIELRLSRFVGDGLHEDLDLTNFTQESVSLKLAVQLDADFVDIEETAGDRLQQGELSREWKQIEEKKWQLLFHYCAEHNYDHQGERGTARIDRSMAVEIENSDSAPSYENGKISFPVLLPAHGSWHACINFIPTVEGLVLQPLYRCRAFQGSLNEWERRRALFLSDSTDFKSPETENLTNTVVTALECAKRDLAALRLYDLDTDENAWTMAAGVPIYVALFGRDTLTASMQAALVGPQMMKGTLLELVKLQGKKTNDWRDEEPGRMIHEAHTGPLELLNFNPRARSYSSVTTSGFFPAVVAELWHWTGDKSLIEPLLEPALKALQWADQYGDLDRDGFYEYQTRSTQGVENQAWKDSGDAVVYEDGTKVLPPIAMCEEQAFIYIAKALMSEVLWSFHRKDEASHFFRQASELKKRFNEAFWMEERGFFAMGLDSRKRQIRSITSNPGHCLAAGIVDQGLVEPTVGRMIAADLYSGWGIRTLSSEHPAYNPYSYHRGSVWPVEQGTFAIGFVRYGFPKLVHLLAKAQFEAAQLFNFCRLPELFAGHQRDEDHPFPALYPNANSPQAWSSSTVFCFIQAMLGIYPYAPLRLLLVDPHLPDWLPEITLSNLHVGKATAAIRFFRKQDGTSDYEVQEIQGSLHVIRQPSPWSLTATFPERVMDLLTSLLPGK